MNLRRELSIFLAVSFLVDLGRFVFVPLFRRFFWLEIAWCPASGNPRNAFGRFKHDAGRLAIVGSRSYAK
jgi:hypothetical protein